MKNPHYFNIMVQNTATMGQPPEATEKTTIVQPIEKTNYEFEATSGIISGKSPATTTEIKGSEYARFICKQNVVLYI